MNNRITFRQAVSALTGAGVGYQVLELGGSWKAIITQYGGRLLGPFLGDQGESLLWSTPALKDAGSLRDFVRARSWNLGGERVWVNPELKYFCKAPELFNQTYTVQDALDPGNYSIKLQPDGIHLEQSVKLEDLGNKEIAEFSLRRRYATAPNPLAYVKGLRDLGVDYCGFVQDLEIADRTPGGTCLEPWILTQINPGGSCITPFFGDFDFVDYYDPVGNMQTVRDGYAELKVDGATKYKVGYRTAQTFGRMAHVHRDGDRVRLMVRNFYNDPSIPYCSEPWGDLGNKGCSVFYYNDDGSTGGFAEFENSCATVGPEARRSQSSSTTSLWFFFGSEADIRIIMRSLLGVDYQPQS